MAPNIARTPRISSFSRVIADLPRKQTRENLVPVSRQPPLNLRPMREDPLARLPAKKKETISSPTPPTCMVPPLKTQVWRLRPQQHRARGNAWKQSRAKCFWKLSNLWRSMVIITRSRSTKSSRGRPNLFYRNPAAPPPLRTPSSTSHLLSIFLHLRRRVQTRSDRQKLLRQSERVMSTRSQLNQHRRNVCLRGRKKNRSQ